MIVLALEWRVKIFSSRLLRYNDTIPLFRVLLA